MPLLDVVKEEEPVVEEEPVLEEVKDEKPVVEEDPELEDVKEKFARSMADLDNFKKRIDRDRKQQDLKSKGLAVSSFLEVVELIDRASNSDYPDLASAEEGISGIQKFTKTFLEKILIKSPPNFKKVLKKIEMAPTYLKTSRRGPTRLILQ